MSRGKQLLVAGLAVFALTISTGEAPRACAQESAGASLSQRLSSLTSAFKRKKPTPSASGKPAAQRRPQSASTSRPRPSSVNNNVRSQAESRSGLSALIPEGLFGRKKSPAEGRLPASDGTEYNPPEPPPFVVESAPSAPAVPQLPPVEPKVEAKVVAPAKTGRAGSAAASVARKSPSTGRQEDLDATLSDLLENEPILTAEDRKQAAAPVAIPPVTDEEPAVATKTANKSGIIAKVSEEIETEALTEPAAEAVVVAEEATPAVEAVATEEAAEAAPAVVAAAPVEKPAPQRAKGGLDISSAIESVAAEAVDDEDEEASLAVNEVEADEAEVVAAAKSKKPGPSRVDVHETLLSGELYDELTEAEAEAAADTEEIAAETVAEPSFMQHAGQGNVAPRPTHMRTSPQVEQRVAEVTALPFETLGEEPPAAPEPRLENPAEEFVVEDEPTELPEPTVQRDEFTARDLASQPNRIRTEPLPITNLRKPTGDVLMTSEQPVIVSHVEGPRSILVGREASYRVILENTSNIDAQNLSAAIQVPEWADLVDVVSTSGEVARGAQAEDGALEWRLPELAARSSQTLRLRLVPRSGREFQLGVQWSQESTTAAARVQVQEPKLQMSIQGPQEVLFGSPQRFRLTIFNPGTGPAERVAVCLIPPGKDSSEAATHAIGTLGPEEVKEIEMELTAREGGELVLQASATAAGGLQAEAIKRVHCHKPELEVDWRGPDEKYAGTETAYYFRVRNPGTAPTDPLEVRVRLPEGIRFLSASDSHSVDAPTGVVTWRLAGLTPGEEQFMQVRCQLESPGAKEFDVCARTVGGEIRDTESIRTNVVALADLKLDILDPQGARPVGETVVYEIRVENRGTTDAHGVSIVGLFSEGIDPVSVEGAQHSIRDGRVTFQPVKSLPAGGEVLLRIRAVASQVGTHIFRAEVNCQDLDLKLAAEETTRFFQDEFHWKEGETPYTAEQSNTKRR